MASHSSMHASLEWAKERLEEIDATLAAFEGGALKLRADARARAESAVADIRVARDAFRKAIKEYGQAAEADFERSKSRLEKNWTTFEVNVQGFINASVTQAEAQAAAFRVRADAQRKAWAEQIDELQKSAATFSSAGMKQAQIAIARMRTDADAGKAKLEKLGKAGGESWEAMELALTETRSALDKARQATIDALGRVT